MSSPADNKSICCDHFLSDKGCVKGASCDYAHPTAPNGTQTNVVCEYYASKRGCNKGDECNFLHPRRVSPSGEDALKYCDFYLTPSGCAESKKCKFLHPRAMPSKANLRGVGMATGIQLTGRPLNRDNKFCHFFNSPSGCKNGDACKYEHSQAEVKPQRQFRSTRGAAPHNPKTSGSRGLSIHPFIKRPQTCQFFNSEKGCVKGELCNFVHRSEKACEFFNSERGCKKGDLCDFTHTPK